MALSFYPAKIVVCNYRYTHHLFSSSTCSIQRCKTTSAKSWFAAAGKYIKKVAEVSVAQTQKRCNKTEEQLKDEIDVSACDLVDTGVRAESFAML